jgi:transcription initiation factor TFIIIB Brf1 subunit/transcription initiation factor TFIIB
MYNFSGNVFGTNVYTPHVTPVTQSEPEVIRIIRGLNINPEIQAMAVETYYQLESDEKKFQGKVTPVKARRKERKVFTCVFIAFNNNGYPADPNYVSDLTGMDKGEIETAFNELLTPVTVDPIKLARHYLLRIIKSHNYNPDITEQIMNEIRQIYNVCNQNSPDYINNSPAKNIAIGIIIFNLTKTHSCVLNKDRLSEDLYLSWPQVRKHSESISKIYNSTPGQRV